MSDLEEEDVEWMDQLPETLAHIEAQEANQESDDSFDPDLLLTEIKEEPCDYFGDPCDGEPASLVAEPVPMTDIWPMFVHAVPSYTDSEAAIQFKQKVAKILSKGKSKEAALKKLQKSGAKEIGETLLENIKQEALKYSHDLVEENEQPLKSKRIQTAKRSKKCSRRKTSEKTVEVPTENSVTNNTTNSENTEEPTQRSSSSEPTINKEQKNQEDLESAISLTPNPDLENSPAVPSPELSEQESEHDDWVPSPKARSIKPRSRKPATDKSRARARRKPRERSQARRTGGMFKCSYKGCDKSYDRITVLRGHVRIKHEPWQFRCDYSGCDKLFPLRILMTKHRRSHSNDRPFPCDKKFCLKTFKSLEEQRRHMKLHYENRPHPCVVPGCDIAFKHPKALDTHVTKVHPGEIENFECPYPGCGKVFPMYYIMKKHEMIHNKERNFVCHYEGCGRAFTTLYYLKGHTWKCHTDHKRYPCSKCGKKFKLRSQLKKHMGLHLAPDERKFLCTDCGKRFSNNDSLKRHLKGHSDDRPFLCTHCGATFKRKEALKRHTASHENPEANLGYQQQMTCLICGVTAKSPFGLRSHMKTHKATSQGVNYEISDVDGSKMYICTEQDCNKAFKTAKYLRDHQYLHYPEAHVCSICGKVFKCFRYLKCHWKTHSEQRKHICKFCDKGFKTSKECARHAETHAETRSFICEKPNCGRAYKTSSTLRIHMKLHKKNELLNREFRHSSIFSVQRRQTYNGVPMAMESLSSTSPPPSYTNMDGNSLANRMTRSPGIPYATSNTSSGVDNSQSSLDLFKSSIDTIRSGIDLFKSNMDSIRSGIDLSRPELDLSKASFNMNKGSLNSLDSSGSIIDYSQSCADYSRSTIDLSRANLELSHSNMSNPDFSRSPVSGVGPHSSLGHPGIQSPPLASPPPQVAMATEQESPTDMTIMSHSHPVTSAMSYPLNFPPQLISVQQAFGFSPHSMHVASSFPGHHPYFHGNPPPGHFSM